MTVEQEIMNYFLQHIQYYKDTLLKPIKDDAGILLQDERFKKDFTDRSKWVIICNICLNLPGVSVDAVNDFMQNISMEELLK